MNAILSEVDVVLLDQGETFMFENDRFGPDQDYAKTYREVGGERLRDEEATEAVTRTFDFLIAAYDSGDCDDEFPTVSEAVSLCGLDLPDEEVALLDDVIAEHETGTISEAHRATVHALRRLCPLGIISNVFAQPARFEHNLQNAGIFDCFDHIVWSSTNGAIKPSAKLFHVALDYWALAPERILYVGNAAHRDVLGADAVGMRTAWIDLHREGLPTGIPEPDLIVHDLTELIEGDPP